LNDVLWETVGKNFAWVFFSCRAKKKCYLTENDGADEEADGDARECGKALKKNLNNGEFK